MRIDRNDPLYGWYDRYVTGDRMDRLTTLQNELYIYFMEMPESVKITPDAFINFAVFHGYGTLYTMKTVMVKVLAEKRS